MHLVPFFEFLGGALFVLSGGSLLTDWGKAHKALTAPAFIIGLLMVGYFYRDRIVDWFGAEQKNHTAQPGSGHASPPPPIPKIPEVDVKGLVKPRLFIGTLPPNGLAAFSYIVNNGDYATSMDNTVAHAWAQSNGSFQKIEERTVGYIGKGDSTTVDRLRSPIPFGKVVFCIEYTKGSKNYSSTYFFQSVGEYAKYGPVREMKQFHDPVFDQSCKSAPQIALRYI